MDWFSAEFARYAGWIVYFVLGYVSVRVGFGLLCYFGAFLLRLLATACLILAHIVIFWEKHFGRDK